MKWLKKILGEINFWDFEGHVWRWSGGLGKGGNRIDLFRFVPPSSFSQTLLTHFIFFPLLLEKM